MWESGLPAMQAPRCNSCTETMPSQASQLPHKPGSYRTNGVAFSAAGFSRGSAAHARSVR
ncbi:hypothetical protein C1X27_08630 [Pseudomonas sp. MPR-AND1B]|nr:hypothetical protein C1X26_11355 [Pseudomonas sp. MPR-R3A]PMZ69978.1 hypothetical protein C1X25_17855 [Pseudomonas sp. GW247-3R2A]PNA95150.1 hypothetical protein C1X23_05595 [Pseudomonas sp. FW300-E2]PNB03419.1 hypothetical protein C1X27_08630 [Pseudomonas sp. MPR-AND1B]PRW70082.1 hypothetical protein C7A09_06560 [Pseudomonas fluorescens]